MNERTNEQPTERTADTPWGHSQGIYHVISGVKSHTTASHGGYQLSPARQNNLASRQMPAAWCCEWYEEDCEIAAVILGFSGEFHPNAVRSALDMVKHLHLGNGGRWSDLWKWADARREIKERVSLDHTVSTRCPMCGFPGEVHTIKADYDRWRSRELLIQVAMPYLSNAQREKLQTGICDPCWSAHMAPTDD